MGKNKKNEWSDYILTAAIFLMLIVPNIHKFYKKTSNEDQYFKDRTVMLKGKEGLCSGEQITAPSGENYILTAAHCRGLQSNNSVVVIKEDGSVLIRKIIAEDAMSDLLLLEGIPVLRGLKIAKEIKQDEHLRTYTHGRGYDTYRTDGSYVQETRVKVPMNIDLDLCTLPKYSISEEFSLFSFGKICMLTAYEEVSTAKVVPGSSGGMVVNDRGELVGVVSATDGDFGYFVRLDDIQMFLAGY